MNTNSLKKCLWLGLVLTMAVSGLLAVCEYQSQTQAWNNRFWSHLALFDQEQRIKMAEDIEQVINKGDMASPYEFALTERTAAYYRGAIERNQNLDHQSIPEHLQTRAARAKSPNELDALLAQQKQRLTSLGRLNLDYLEGQRQWTMYGPFIGFATMNGARYLAGKIEMRSVWQWAIHFFLIASLLSLVLNGARASECRIHPLLLLFLPEVCANVCGMGFVINVVEHKDPIQMRRRGLRNAMGFFSALFSFLGVSAKTFAQERENRDEVMKAPMTLVMATPARNNTWETTCSASTVSQLHPDLDAAIFYAAPVATVSCMQQNGRALLGLLYWRGLSAAPGSSRHEIDLIAGLKLRHGPVQSTFTLVYVNPEPIGQVGKGDALLLTLRQEVAEQKIRGLKLSPFVTTTYATPIKGNLPGRGWILGTGSGYNFQLNSAWLVGGQVKIIRDFGSFGFPKAFLGYASTGLIRDLGSGVTLTLPSVVASTPFTAGSNRGTYVTVGASISKSWK